MRFETSRMARVGRWILVFSVVAVAIHPPPGRAGPAVPDRIAEMAATLIRALNEKDWGRLALLYQDFFPWKLCNNFERLLAVALVPRFTAVVGEEYALERLERSHAELTATPRVVLVSPASGRTSVVFGFHWDFQFRDQEPAGLDLIVTWEIKEIGDRLTIVHQITSPCD